MKTKLLFFFLFGMMVQFNYAQEGILKGTIKDTENSEALAFADVTVKNSSTGISTNLEGNYEMNLKPGIYTVLISFIGYETREISGVKINANDVTELNSAISPVYFEPEEPVAKNSTVQKSEPTKTNPLF